jgi:hypothetical protein
MTSKNTPNKCSVNEAARWIGCARQTLTGWLQDAEIDYSDGIDVPAFLKWKFREEYEKGREAERKKFAHVEQTIEEAQAAGYIDEGEAKRRKLVAQMAQEEIKTAELQGLLIRTEEVAHVVQGEYAILREALLTLPGKAAPRLNVPGEDDRRKILEEEVDGVLSELEADARYKLKQAEAGKT